MEASLSLRKVAVVAFSAPLYSMGGVANAHFNPFRLLQHMRLDARLFTFGDYDREDSLKKKKVAYSQKQLSIHAALDAYLKQINSR